MSQTTSFLPDCQTYSVTYTLAIQPPEHWIRVLSVKPVWKCSLNPSCLPRQSVSGSFTCSHLCDNPVLIASHWESHLHLAPCLPSLISGREIGMVFLERSICSYILFPVKMGSSLLDSLVRLPAPLPESSDGFPEHVWGKLEEPLVHQSYFVLFWPSKLLTSFYLSPPDDSLLSLEMNFWTQLWAATTAMEFHVDWLEWNWRFDSAFCCLMQFILTSSITCPG